jgi:hypothetical protein
MWVIRVNRNNPLKPDQPDQDDRADQEHVIEPVGTCHQCSTRVWNIEALELPARVLGTVLLHRGRCETAWRARSTRPLI